MYAADIIFHCKPVDVDDPLYHLVESGMYDLLIAWERNGQIAGHDFSIAELPDSYTVRVNLPETDSLEAKNNSPAVEKQLAKLPQTPIKGYTVQLVGPIFDVGSVCQCDQQPSFVLFATYSTSGSPVRCGNCFQPVPLYRFPPTRADLGNYEDIILGWQRDYNNCDDLNIASYVLEQEAIAEMSLPDSNLSKEGREICQTIERLTDKPTYYYLYRDKGESLAAERERKCPVCGGEWLLPEKWHLFDFRCDRDRLVSNIAYDLETEDGD